MKRIVTFLIFSLSPGGLSNSSQVYPRDAAPGRDKPSVIVNLACAGSGGRVILPKHEGQTDSFQAEINGMSNYCYGRRGGVLVTTVGPPRCL